MGYFNNYRLVEEDGEYILEIMLGRDMEEFAKEFLSDEAAESSELESKAKELIKEKYANIKVKSIKFIVGTAVIAIIPLYAGSVTAQAANAPTASTHAGPAARSCPAADRSARHSPSEPRCSSCAPGAPEHWSFGPRTTRTPPTRHSPICAT